MAAVESITPRRARWTRQNINRAIRCPKPTGAVRRYHASIAARGEPIDRLLSHIVDHADIIDDGRQLDCDGVKFTHSGAWLLVPLPSDLLDHLLMLGAEQADLEPSEDSEIDHDGEPSLGANEAVAQIAAWGRRPVEVHKADLEDEQIVEGGEDDEPDADDEPSGLQHNLIGAIDAAHEGEA